MSEKLLETQSWLENFSSRWEKVLSRSTCVSQQSRTRPNTGKVSYKGSPDLPSLDNVPQLSQSHFVDFAESEVEEMRGRFADATRLLNSNREELEDREMSLQDITHKIESLQTKFSGIIRSLFDENALLKQEVVSKSQDLSLGTILNDYESHVGGLKFKIEEYEKISASLTSIEENDSLSRPKQILKTLKIKLEKDLKEEQNSHQRLQGVNRKLQMSKKCLQNLKLSNGKVEKKRIETRHNLNGLQDEILSVNNEIKKFLRDRKVITADLKEQRDLTLTLQQLTEKVKFHGKLAKDAKCALRNIKNEDVGIVVLKDLRSYFQKMKDVKRVDLCNQLYLNLTQIYQRKKEAESKETCLTTSVTKHLSRPPSTKAQSTKNKSMIFSFLKEV